MDYTSLIRNAGDKKSRVGIIGATKGYGYTLLAQIPKVKLMELRLISSRHTDECEKVLLELGWPKEKLAVCATKEEIRAAPKDAAAPKPCLNAWDSATSLKKSPIRCPAVRCSALLSPARLSTTPTFCLPMNPPVRLTRKQAFR